MNLPYDPPYQSFWTTLDMRKRTIDDWKHLFTGDAARRSGAILAALVADARTIPSYLGVCMVTAVAHDYEFQNVVIQLHDGTFLAQSWNSLSKTVSDVCPITITLDIPTELRQLRAEGHTLRGPGNHNPDRKSGMEGRFGTIYLAVGTDAEWLTCPRPLLGGEYPNTAVNRIFRAMARLEDQITLL